MPWLKVLDLSTNAITGALPATFDQSWTLMTLTLNDNMLSGPLPPTIMNLTTPYPAMKELNLQNNRFTGSVPEGWFGEATLPIFFPADGLQVLNLRNNQLSGPVPERVSRADTLVALLLNGNAFDTVPASLHTWLAGRKYCDMSGNAWRCPIPAEAVNNCQASCK